VQQLIITTFEFAPHCFLDAKIYLVPLNARTEARSTGHWTIDQYSKVLIVDVVRRFKLSKTLATTTRPEILFDKLVFVANYCPKKVTQGRLPPTPALTTVPN